MFKGVDSPTNIAMISNVAELVARAFSKNANQQNTWDRRQLMERPSEHLEDLDEGPPHQHTSFSNSPEQNIDDNVIVGSSGNAGTSDIDHGIFGKMLSILGMDTSKIGALALNGIIFIAQIVCTIFSPFEKCKIERIRKFQVN